MELIPGVTKEDYSDYVLYYIENFSRLIWKQAVHQEPTNFQWTIESR